MKDKEMEGDRLMKKGNKLLQTSWVAMRLRPDWEEACPLFEKAVSIFKQLKVPRKGRAACEKAAQCQEKLGSMWHAARHLESAAAFASDMSDPSGSLEHYSHAAEFYFEVGRPQAGATALSNGAKAISDSNKVKASQVFARALEVMHDSDDRATAAPNIFRAAISHEIKRGEWERTVSLLLKFGEFCEEKNLHTSQNRSYLGAVVVCLYADDGQQAWATFQDCISISSFSASEEGRAAVSLLEAYRQNDEEAIRETIKTHACFRFLEASVGRLAMKLPKKDSIDISQALGIDPVLYGHEDDLGDEDLT